MRSLRRAGSAAWGGFPGTVPLPTSTHPSQHRLGYGAATQWGPQPGPLCRPRGVRCGVQGAHFGAGGRRVDAAVGSDAAAGPGGLVTAACRERPPAAPRQPGRARHKANAAPAPGRSPPPRGMSPSAGMRGRDTQGWGAQGRAVGLDGQQVAGRGGSQLCPWQRPCGWQSVDVASRPWASDPRGKQAQQRDLGGGRRHPSWAEPPLWQWVPGQEGSPQDHGGLWGRHLLPTPKGWGSSCGESCCSLQNPRTRGGLGGAGGNGFLGSRGG